MLPLFVDVSKTTCYKPIYDGNNKFIKENFFTNSLNILSYIPGISTISGITRIIFAKIMLSKTAKDDKEAIKHYKNHTIRGTWEAVPVTGNIFILVCDSVYAIFSKWKENDIKDPNVNKTENWFKL